MIAQLRLFRGLGGGLATIAFCSGLFAQTQTPWLEVSERPFDFYAEGEYRMKLPRPEEVLGYEPGQAYA
ncbi:MAG: hypothetical protein J6386_25070 [Candidatus Synoicihabitans palmerolidicus]|nr:hypothetical protein [Candidatus Synoicihabitans palmerolidicus]